jgi:hypothetical protein
VGSGERTALERSLVRVCTALRTADVPFALTGGSGIYARGGPFSEHDVDVLVRPADVDDAVRALVSVGMRATDAPEDCCARYTTTRCRWTSSTGPPNVR